MPQWTLTLWSGFMIGTQSDYSIEIFKQLPYIFSHFHIVLHTYTNKFVWASIDNMYAGNSTVLILAIINEMTRFINDMFMCSVYRNKVIMGIDLATWRARIGLNYYHMCRPLQTRWRSSGGRLYQSGVSSWGVGEVINDTPLVLKGCMTVVALSLILKYAVHSWSKLKGRAGGGKVRCHWRESTCQAKAKVDGGGCTLLLRAIMVVIPLLLVIAGDVETNPGPGGNCVCACA